MRPGPTATTPGARSRSSAWSRRMNRSSGAGRRRTHSGRLTRAEPSGPARRIPSPAVASLLKRLAASGAAYQASSLVAGFLALFTLPLYTRHLTRAELGYAETLLTAIILVSILLRFGVGEAFVRFYFDDADDARRDRLAQTTTSFAFVTSTIAALVAVALAGPLSSALLGIRDATLMAFGVLGLWAFTNLEI